MAPFGVTAMASTSTFKRSTASFTTGTNVMVAPAATILLAVWQSRFESTDDARVDAN